MHERIIVIGSGLGGLSTALILARNGYEVKVLEQGNQIGGCLQCFTRHGAMFETGMHYIGSADKEQYLYRLMQYLGITGDIRLSRLDPAGYDVIAMNGSEYRFANGKEGFIEGMSAFFPHQKDNLRRYFETIEKVASASSLHTLKYDVSDSAINTEYQLRSINDVIDSLITDPELAKVLVGNLPLYAGERDKTPFSTHAFIMDFYNQSAFRIIGGSETIAAALSRQLHMAGGSVEVRKKVTRIVCNDSRATGVETADGEFYPADIIISSTHPRRTLEMIDSRLIRPIYRNRINNMPQTIGGFCVYLQFKEDTVPYMNSNYYSYRQDSPWNCEKYSAEDWPLGYLYMHFCQEESQRYARTGSILSYMRMDEVEGWLGTQVGRRGEAYESFKQEKAERLIDMLEKDVPGIRGKIARYYTSTPLTYYDYTGTEDGSMYGIAKDINLGSACRVSQRTKIPNVFLTGQNINSHGMLGVLVGTIVTCSEILTAPEIYRQITEANR